MRDMAGRAPVLLWRTWRSLTVMALTCLCFSRISVADVPTLNLGLPQLSDPNATIERLTSKVHSGSLAGQQLAEAYLGLCGAKTQIGDIKGAIDDCTQSINAVDLKAPRLIRSELYLFVKNYPAALDDLAALSRLEPNNPNWRGASAVIYWSLGDIDKYAVETDAEIALVKDQLTGLKNRAEIYFNNGYWERALADYEAILAREPDNAEILHYRGDAKSFLGRYDDGMADYDHALRLDPKGQAQPIAMAKSNSLFDQRRYADAMVQAQIAADAAPDNAYMLLWLNLMRAHAGKPDDQDFSRRSEKIDPKAWPYSVIAYEQGKISEEQVWAVASAGVDAQAASNQKCEADFYVGDYKFARDRAGAMTLLREAADKCFKGYIEYAGAVFELRALGEDVKFGH